MPVAAEPFVVRHPDLIGDADLLTDHERALVRNRDYAGLLAAGVNIYAIAKSGYVFGATLLDIGAAMRGESVQQFLATKGLG